MGNMVLGIAYLSVNLLTLCVLLWRRYWASTLFPIFVGAQTLTCWQAAVRLMTGENKAWWTPGEVLLLVATCAAVLEAVWASVRVMRPAWRYMVLFGLISWAAGTAWLFQDPLAGDLYHRFLRVRESLFLALGLLSFAAFWCGLAVNDYWPRVARMHAGLYAVLMAGHASLISWANWGNTNSHYRWLEMTCCLGWILNCYFLGRERRESARKVGRDALHSPADHRPRLYGYPPTRGGFREPHPQGR